MEEEKLFLFEGINRLPEVQVRALLFSACQNNKDVKEAVLDAVSELTEGEEGDEDGQGGGSGLDQAGLIELLAGLQAEAGGGDGPGNSNDVE
mmetsp:Transcript_43521/g.85201  ORF Transcript_43521/g.85201 Transcript_43521/m.85201 type:complete len:92 (+) Transcript_43521:39-314(+)|eukprot:CAMPEP_0175130056 /NCGR_PEP_ID=MMETSP0087-20121206/5803_1 /TAXON_ID=136419 /ORGANISM="Unknown Unknown, Strain D1" /LENGTH=91 /DNA_ID=CAMNT_0016412249 /DNA_START=23 /DNA_END=298 /DNA_ORIENTATION=-